jgi:hypothetical protein
VLESKQRNRNSQRIAGKDAMVKVGIVGGTRYTVGEPHALHEWRNAGDPAST